MFKTVSRKAATAALAVSTFVQSTVAHAQDGNGGSSDWVQPATGIFGDLEAGLVDIAIMVIGVGIVIAGLYMGAQGKIEPQKVGAILVAGVLITAGPAAMRSLLG